MATARSQAALDRLSKTLDGDGRLILQPVDVTDQASAAVALDRAAAEFGAVRGVVNAAAVGDGGMLGSEPDADRVRAILMSTCWAPCCLRPRRFRT